MMPEGMEVTGRVAELLRHVDDARQARLGECVRLLSELTPQLQAAVAADRQRERHEAPRFNVFKYLREDELGLSRIIADLLDSTCHYRRGKYSSVSIYRDAWIRYDDLPSTQQGRSAIMLQSGRQGPNGWYWGVRSPKALGQMTETEKERREELATTLGRQGLSLTDDSDWWPQWEWLPRYQNWHPLAPELYEECEAGGGPVTSYYADGLLKIAEHAIRAINKVEMVNRASSGE